MRIKKEAKFWDVRLSIPSTMQIKQSDGSVREYSHSKNIHLMVVAESVEKVNDLAMAEHPEATIHQINHRGGDCGIIVQPELLA